MTMKYNALTGQINVSQPGSSSSGNSQTDGAYNLGIDLTSGTFTIQGSDGNTLSSSNVGYIYMPSSTVGQSIQYQITTDQSFDDASAAGGSDIIGNLFGLTTGVAESNDVPFYIYAVSDSTEATVSFGISRIPNLVVTPAAGSLGSPSSATADVQASVFFFDSVTLANYAARPVICIGSFRMTMSASDDWTVSTLAANDGMGKFQEGIVFDVVAGQYGNAAGKYFADNGGTAPAFTSNTNSYMISPAGFIMYNGEFVNCSSGGVGGVSVQQYIPFEVSQFTISSTYYTDNNDNKTYPGASRVLDGGKFMTFTFSEFNNNICVNSQVDTTDDIRFTTYYFVKNTV